MVAACRVVRPVALASGHPAVLTVCRPGAYKVDAAWTRRQQTALAAPTASADASSCTSRSSKTVRVPGPVSDAGCAQHEALMSTPPSIPARHQSWGYESAAEGRLVMQQPAAAAQTTDSKASPAGSKAKSRQRPAPPAAPAAGVASHAGTQGAIQQALAQRLQQQPAAPPVQVAAHSTASPRSVRQKVHTPSLPACAANSRMCRSQLLPCCVLRGAGSCAAQAAGWCAVTGARRQAAQPLCPSLRGRIRW
jgi:hypothetical protein